MLVGLGRRFVGAVLFLVLFLGHLVALALVFTGGVRWDSGMFLTALMLLMGLVGLVSLVFGLACLALLLVYGLFGLAAFALSFILYDWAYALASGILLNVASLVFARSKDYRFCYSRSLAYSEMLDSVVYCGRPLLCRVVKEGVYEGVWLDRTLLDRAELVLSHKSSKGRLLVGTMNDGRAVAGYYDDSTSCVALCGSIYECIPNVVEWIGRLDIGVLKCRGDVARLVAGLAGAKCKEM